MTISMRLILTTIILTMLAQPASSETVKYMMDNCVAWQKLGFKNDMPANYDGLSAAICWGFVSGWKVEGELGCIERALDSDYSRKLAFEATQPQIAQALINFGRANPDKWDALAWAHGDRFLNTFGCKK